MTLREVLLSRLERRVLHSQGSARTEAQNLIARIDAGHPVTVSAGRLAAALIQAKLIDAAGHAALLDHADAPTSYVITEDGSYSASA
jgi:hypothetical protein